MVSQSEEEGSGSHSSSWEDFCPDLLCQGQFPALQSQGCDCNEPCNISVSVSLLVIVSAFFFVGSVSFGIKGPLEWEERRAMHLDLRSATVLPILLVDEWHLFGIFKNSRFRFPQCHWHCSSDSDNASGWGTTPTCCPLFVQGPECLHPEVSPPQCLSLKCWPKNWLSAQTFNFSCVKPFASRHKYP